MPTSPDTPLPQELSTSWSRGTRDPFANDEGTPGGDEPEAGAQSIRRTLAILQTVAAGRQSGFRLTDIAAITQMSRPTAHRLLKVLAEDGFVTRSPSSGRYYIGPQLSLLALARPALPPLLRCIEGHLNEISAEFGETTYFSVRSGLDSVCVSRTLGQHPIQVIAIEVGDRRPLAGITSGLAMLAAASPDKAGEAIASDLARLGSMDIDPVLAHTRVAKARAKGYYVREDGLPPGTKAVAAAVSLVPGIPFGAISVAGTVARMPAKRCHEIAQFILRRSDSIATTLRRVGW